MLETIRENIEKLGKIHNKIITSNNPQDQTHNVQKFLDVSSKFILKLLLTTEGLETGIIRYYDIYKNFSL